MINSLKNSLPSFFEQLPQYIENIKLGIAEEGYIIPYYATYNDDKSAYNLPDEDRDLVYIFRNHIEEYLGEYILDSIGSATITFYRGSPDFKIEYN